MRCSGAAKDAPKLHTLKFGLLHGVLELKCLARKLIGVELCSYTKQAGLLQVT
jgi:hypothetical protein